MVSINQPRESLALTVSADALFVNGYENRDSAVIAHFAAIAPDDQVEHFDRCVSIGVRVVDAVGPSLDAEFVRRQFDATVERQQQILTNGAQMLQELISASFEPLFGTDGSVPTLLNQTEQTIAEALSKYFDETSAKSVAAVVSRKVEEQLQNNERRVSQQLSEALNVADESRGLGKVFKALRKEGQQIGSNLADLMAHVTGIVERRDERESSTRKGVEFEPTAFDELARIARVHGDLAEPTGKAMGDARRFRGDAVVTLGLPLTGGTAARIAVEIMDRSSERLPAVLRELDEAKVNRSAAAAIAILSTIETPAACRQRIQRHGDRYVVVLDKQTWDSVPLELAYWHARVDVLRAAEASPTGVDLDAASRVLDEASGHLTELDRVRSKLSTARRAIDDTDALVNALRGNLRRCFARIQEIFAETSAVEEDRATLTVQPS